MAYRISEMADKCGVNKETIRYYERKGLIQYPARTHSGYRVYAEDTVNRVGFIKRMQELGFTLKEVGKLLGIVDRDAVKCSDIYEFVDEKIVDVQLKIRDLKKVEQILNDLKSCCKNDENLHQCSIIETLMDKDSKLEKGRK